MNGRTLVVSSTKVILEGWKAEFGGRDAEYMVINSAAKKSVEVDLLIIDECQRSLSLKYRAVFHNVKYKYLLCLTASLPEDKEKTDFLNVYAPVVYEMKVEDAKPVMAPYTIFNIGFNLGKATKGKYDAYNRQFNAAAIELSRMKRMFSLEDNIFDIAKKYSTVNDGSDLCKVSKQYWYFMQLRKRLLYDNKDKLSIIKEILKQESVKRCIIFVKSIAYAEWLSNELGHPLYHSKLKKEEKQRSLEEFDRVLIGVDGLNEGLNIVDLDTAICVSGVATPLIQIQQLGRVNRFLENKVAKFYNIYAKGTPEERWVMNKTKSFKCQELTPDLRPI